MRRIWGDRGIRWPGLRSDAVYDGGNERGAILVLFSLVLGLILLISVIVVDVGNWNVHAKRLQTLVDAGAFAGATKFVGCSFQFGDPVAANAAIKATALGYSGDTARDPATLNLQEQEPDDVRVVLNSARYWADGDPMTGIGLDDTLDHDNSLLTPAGDPCSTKTLDVKATDDDAPLLFGFLPMVIDPKRKAKVEIRQIKEQSGMLPWAVPDIEPEAVVAIFVDEINGDVLASQLLMQADDPGLPFSEWKTSAFEETVDIANENTGVVILVSKVDDDPLRTGSLAQICSQDPSLVDVLCRQRAGGRTYVHPRLVRSPRHARRAADQRRQSLRRRLRRVLRAVLLAQRRGVRDRRRGRDRLRLQPRSHACPTGGHQRRCQAQRPRLRQSGLRHGLRGRGVGREREHLENERVVDARPSSSRTTELLGQLEDEVPGRRRSLGHVRGSRAPVRRRRALWTDRLLEDHDLGPDRPRGPADPGSELAKLWPTAERDRHRWRPEAAPHRGSPRSPDAPTCREPVGKPEPGVRLRQERQLRDRDREWLHDDLRTQLRRLGYRRTGTRSGQTSSATVTTSTTCRRTRPRTHRRPSA